MFNFFEQPWTLIGAAILVLFAVLTFRSVCPEKRRWWQWLLPLVVAVAAVGLDVVVKTDLEKINAVINTGMKAVERQDYNVIEDIITDNYYDSYHNNKEQLIADCRKYLSQNQIKKGKKTGILIKVSPPNATANLFAVITLDENSRISRNYKSFFFIKADIRLQKQPNKNWLISRIEIPEIDRQPVNWGQIR